MYMIENNAGMFWNGVCWGVCQAAEEYERLEDLPEIISEDSEKCLIKEIFSTKDPLDIRYY